MKNKTITIHINSSIKEENRNENVLMGYFRGKEKTPHLVMSPYACNGYIDFPTLYRVFLDRKEIQYKGAFVNTAYERLKDAVGGDTVKWRNLNMIKMSDEELNAFLNIKYELIFLENE